MIKLFGLVIMSEKELAKEKAVVLEDLYNYARNKKGYIYTYKENNNIYFMNTDTWYFKGKKVE